MARFTWPARPACAATASATRPRKASRKVDALLARAGSDRTRILQVVIWLSDMADFEAMNAVWDAWVPEGHSPARACGESKLASPEPLVEIVTAACD